MLDIIIAVCLGVVTLSTAYLGMHVTLHPAESDRARRWYKAGFIVCGCAAIVLTVWQAQRNHSGQIALQKSLDQIDENTKNAPRLITAVASLDFGTVVDGGCSSDQTIALKGANVRDSPAIGWPQALPKGVTGESYVARPDFVSVRICNLSGGPVKWNSIVTRVSVSH